MEQLSLSALQRSRQVKDYICTNFSEDPIPMKNVLNTSQEAGLKEIQVPQNVAKMLYMFARLIRPKRVLEIETLHQTRPHRIFEKPRPLRAGSGIAPNKHQVIDVVYCCQAGCRALRAAWPWTPTP